MKNFIKLIFSVFIGFCIYSMIVFFLEKFDNNLIFNKFSFIILLVMINVMVIIIIMLNKLYLKEYCNKITHILKISCMCSAISVLSILIFYKIPGLNESLDWFLLATLVGIIFLFITYFILLLLFKNHIRKSNIV